MKQIVRILFLAMFLVGIPVVGLACTCDLPVGNVSQTKQVEKARKEARAVFSGRVLEIVQAEHSVTVKLRVQSIWKGELADEVAIFTGSGSGDCGYRFEVGVTYLVYAYGDHEANLSTNICTRTVPLAPDGVDLKILGKSKAKRA